MTNETMQLIIPNDYTQETFKNIGNIFERYVAEKKDIAEAFSKEASALRILDVEDTEGYKAVREKRLTIRSTRLAISKEIDAVEEPIKKTYDYIRKERLELEKAFKKIEDGLSKMEDQYEAEKERIKAEIARKKVEKLNNRISALATFGRVMDINLLENYTDNEFETVLEQARVEHIEKQLLLQKQIDLMEAEKARIAREQAELAQKELDLKNREQELNQKSKETAANLERIDKERALVEESIAKQKLTESHLTETKLKIQEFIPELSVIMDVRQSYLNIMNTLNGLKTSKGKEFAATINTQNTHILNYLDKIIAACK